MSNKLYDILKWIAQILLPACGTLYFALAGIWNFPYGEQIVGTITAIDTFLGVCLGISTANYYKEQNQLKQDEMEEDDIEAIEGDDEE
jgi:imidazoleglycerol phosphate synthase glutamine amidotransferase subunit HisH